jgi:hypothetical protein
LVFRRRPKRAGIVESRFGTEVWACGSDGSITASVEYMELDELWAPLSRFAFPLRLKMVFPKICTLSGRSREGMLLDVDRPEDFLESALPSSALFSHEGRSAEVSDRSEDEPDELVWWLWCLSRTDARFICWLISRRLSGDGGPSTAGSKSLSMVWESCGTASDDVTGRTGTAWVSLWGLCRPRNLDFLEPCLEGLALLGREGSRSTRYTGMLEAA